MKNSEDLQFINYVFLNRITFPMIMMKKPQKSIFTIERLLKIYKLSTLNYRGNLRNTKIYKNLRFFKSNSLIRNKFFNNNI